MTLNSHALFACQRLIAATQKCGMYVLFMENVIELEAKVIIIKQQAP
jgi:hypothetical protein